MKVKPPNLCSLSSDDTIPDKLRIMRDVESPLLGIGAPHEHILWPQRINDHDGQKLTYHKWSIVLAGISDMYRPVEKLSLTQNAALTATGLIWTRWCLIIKPRNILYVFAQSR